MSAPAVRLSGVGKRFGETAILSELSLEIADGEFVAVVGRSGSGKSTLLRLVLGLERPDAGMVMTPGSPNMRLMFQEPRLLPWARVLANVEVGLGGAHDPARALSALDEVGLRDRAQAWPETLSGGQRQRVALARALVSRPRLLTLDEPLGALDALTRLDMQALLERVWMQQRSTALLVTHDVEEAVALADRVLVLKDGSLALALRIDFERPRQRDAVEFTAAKRKLLSILLD